MLLREIISFYYENYTKAISTLCGKKSEFFMIKQVAYVVTIMLRMFKRVVMGTDRYGLLVRIRCEH
jgi:hypothetical protein